jgi:hypothetical protein
LQNSDASRRENMDSHLTRCHAPRRRGIQHPRGVSLQHSRLWNAGSFVRRRTSAVKRFRRGYAFRARRSFSEGGKPGDDNGERSRLKLECEAIALSRRPGQARDSKRRSGTHSHRRIVLSTLGPLPFATTQAGGYGSPPSGTTARDETAGGDLRASAPRPYTAAAVTTCARRRSRLACERWPFMVAAKRSRMPSSKAVTMVSCT